MAKIKLIAKTFVLNDENKILVLRRSETDTRRPLGWDIPGGELEFGESPAEAAIREAKEESGIDLTEVRLINIHSEVYDGIQIITFIYSAKYIGQPIMLSYEHDFASWKTINEVQKTDLPKKYRNATKLLK